MCIRDRSKGSGKALEQFGRDLTQLAAQGKIDPVIGRQNEIERVIQILSRRTKNNPVLIGEPGVGKTAVAEGLALKIHSVSYTHLHPEPGLCAIAVQWICNFAPGFLAGERGFGESPEGCGAEVPGGVSFCWRGRSS